METQTTIQEHVCLRCQHRWLPRYFKRPQVCPVCKSYLWDKPRKALGGTSVAAEGNGQHE